MGIYPVQEAEVGGLILISKQPRDRQREDLLRNTGLSMSITSLSICTSRETVSSKSALNVRYIAAQDVQDLE